MTMPRITRTFLFLTAVALLAYARADYDPIRITGLLKDTFRDPIDAEYLFFYVETTGGAYYVAADRVLMASAHSNCLADTEAPVGAQISVSGLQVNMNHTSVRPYTAQEIWPREKGSSSVSSKCNRNDAGEIQSAPGARSDGHGNPVVAAVKYLNSNKSAYFAKPGFGSPSPRST